MRRFYLTIIIGALLLGILAIFTLWPKSLAIAAFAVFGCMTIAPLIQQKDD